MREQMQVLPGPPVEQEDYEAWAQSFLKTMVSRFQVQSFRRAHLYLGGVRSCFEGRARRYSRGDGGRGERAPRDGRRRLLGSVGRATGSEHSAMSEGGGGGEGM